MWLVADPFEVRLKGLSVSVYLAAAHNLPSPSDKRSREACGGLPKFAWLLSLLSNRRP
ncbi:hypothetical protein TIFTF001_024215 [Ficus carica]|uniref:Uncharacterized protein n=1 Tax=Ficus carica TaxID=3494 RepID=A0AA88AKZ4_FICCA|nr:hypothetical protein TIFTF001_024215 [Ficus carica]